MPQRPETPGMLTLPKDLYQDEPDPIEETNPGFFNTYKAARTWRQARDVTMRVAGAANDIAYPSVGGYAGATAGSVLGPEGTIAGGAIGSAAGKALQHGVEAGTRALFGDEGPPPPPPRSVMGEEQPTPAPWWNEYLTEAAYGAVGEAIPMGMRLASSAPSLRSLLSPSKYIDEAFGGSVERMRAAMEGISEGANIPKDWQDILNRNRQLDPMGEAVIDLENKLGLGMRPVIDRATGEVMEGLNTDYFGYSRFINPRTLPELQYKRFLVNRQTAARAARENYKLLDWVVGHEKNTNLKSSLHTGWVNGPKGKISKRNPYNIHLRFDYTDVTTELEDLAETIFKPMLDERLPRDGRLAKVMTRLMDHSSNRYVSWKVAYADLAELKRMARSPEYGTAEPWQIAAGELYATMRPHVMRTLREGAEKVWDPSTGLKKKEFVRKVFESLEKGNADWRKFKAAFSSPEAIKLAKGARLAGIGKLTGTADEAAATFDMVSKQYGTPAIRDWARRHWQKTVDAAGKVSPDPLASRQEGLDAVTFDKLFNKPGVETTSILFPDGGSYALAVGRDAADATRLALFDDLMKTKNYGAWLNFADRTKYFVCRGDPLLVKQMDNFFQQMAVIAKSKDVDKVLSNAAQSTSKQLAILGVKAAGYTLTPGSWYVKHMGARFARDMVASGNVDGAMEFIKRLGFYSRSVLLGISQQAWPRTLQYIPPPPEIKIEDVDLVDPSKVKLLTE